MDSVEVSEVMDRGAARIRLLHDVSGWLLEHWDDIPQELYKFNRGSFEPVDVLEHLTELMRRDLANAATKAIHWRIFKGEFPEDELKEVDEVE